MAENHLPERPVCGPGRISPRIVPQKRHVMDKPGGENNSGFSNSWLLCAGSVDCWMRKNKHRPSGNRAVFRGNRFGAHAFDIERNGTSLTQTAATPITKEEALWENGNALT